MYSNISSQCSFFLFISWKASMRWIWLWTTDVPPTDCSASQVLCHEIATWHVQNIRFSLISLLCFVRCTNSSFVHCALYTFLTRPAFVYRVFIYQAFCVRLLCVHRPCVAVLRSFSVNSFTVRSSVRLHVRSAFVYTVIREIFVVKNFRTRQTVRKLNTQNIFNIRITQLKAS